MSFGPKAWKNAPDNTTPLSAAALIDLETRLSNYTDAEVAALLGTLQVVEVNALPGSPVDGQQVDYYPSGTIGSGVCWRCTWRDSLNGSAGAWAVQGPPIEAFAAGGSTTSTSFVDLPGGPSLTIPVAGTYDWEVGCDVRNSGANWNLIQPSALADGDSACIRYQFSAGNVLHPAFRRWAGLPTTAGTKVARVRLIGGGTGDYFSVLFAAFPRELRP